MKIEQVRLKRTLKAGKNVWVEGSYFPNKEYASIPHDILLEVALGTGTIEVTKQFEEKVIQLPAKAEVAPELTSISANVSTSVTDRASLEEALVEEKRVIEAVEKPKIVKRKSKLVRRV
jgi:hypothetical protein